MHPSVQLVLHLISSFLFFFSFFFTFDVIIYNWLQKLAGLSLLISFFHADFNFSLWILQRKKLIPTTIGSRKRYCAWGCARGKNTTWENLQIEKHKSVRYGEQNERLPDLCFSICRFSQVVFIPRAQPHAQSLFLFPIVFGFNLIHFFDEKKDGAAGNSIVCFAASNPCQAILTVRILRRMRTVSKSATFLATESVNSAPINRGETKAPFTRIRVIRISGSGSLEPGPTWLLIVLGRQERAWGPVKIDHYFRTEPESHSSIPRFQFFSFPTHQSLSF